MICQHCSYIADSERVIVGHPHCRGETWCDCQHLPKGTKVVDVNPAIFDNPTLGQAANGQFLDVIEAQMNENHAAEIEGREPRQLTRRNDYPGYNQPSNIASFDDGIVEVPPGPPPFIPDNCVGNG